MENQTLVVQPVDESIAIYTGASLLSITDEEQENLLADFDTNLIEIRPDGMIYLPQVFWRQRLNKTFGIGQWCHIPKGVTKDPERNKLYLEGIMMIRGFYVSTAVGEAEYHDNNKGQSWASVWESAKSDCITRCCKDLGIASLLWQPQFSQQWLQDNAAKVFVNNNGNSKAVWRKKDAKPFWNETGYCQDSPNHPNQPQNPPTTNKKQPITLVPDAPLLPSHFHVHDWEITEDAEMAKAILDEYYELWGKTLDSIATKHVLMQFYANNKVTVDGDENLKKLFKEADARFPKKDQQRVNDGHNDAAKLHFGYNGFD